MNSLKTGLTASCLYAVSFRRKFLMSESQSFKTATRWSPLEMYFSKNTSTDLRTSARIGAESTCACVMPVSFVQKSVRVGKIVGRTKLWN